MMSNASASHEVYLQTKNFSSLNGIRCICCLAVIKNHVDWVTIWPRLTNYGQLGVDLFFCISGFLIVTLLTRERERSGTISLKKFYARRTLRIFPIYYLMIISVFLFYLAISPWAPNGLNFYLLTFAVLLTYTQDIILVPLGSFFHCWSLAMEEQFYLFWPTVERYAPRLIRWFALVALIALNQGVNFGLFDDLITRVYGTVNATRLPLYLITFTPILLGVSLAYLLHDRHTYRVMFWLVGARVSCFFLLAVLFGLAEWTPDVSRGWSRSLVHLTLMLILASLVVREDNYARPILTFAPIARIGVISYGVYLYHVFVMQGVMFLANRMHIPDPNRIMLFIVVSLLTCIVSEASYRLIEAPLLRYKQRFHS